MNNKECIAWLTKYFHSSDIAAIADALTRNIDWLLGLQPDVIEGKSTCSCLPPIAAAGIFLGTAAMVHTNQAFRAQFWLEEAINAYHTRYPNGFSSWRGNTPVYAAKLRYPALNMVLFDAARMCKDWQQASSILESLGKAEEEIPDNINQNFTRAALKNIIQTKHPLGPLHYNERWLLAAQESLITANVLDKRYVTTWKQYTRHLCHLMHSNRINDAVAFAHSKMQLIKHLNVTSTETDHFYLCAIGVFSYAGQIDEALSGVMELIRRNDFDLDCFVPPIEPNARMTPEIYAWMTNLLENADFKTLQQRYLTHYHHHDFNRIIPGAFKSIYEKTLGGKSRKRCAISRKLISPGDAIYQFRMLDNVDHIAATAAFEASEFYVWAQHHKDDVYSWQNFASATPGRGCFEHPDITRYIFERLEGKSFDAAEFVNLLANPIVFPMRFEWISGLSFEKRHPADAFFVNDDLAGEFVNLCWVAIKCGHANEIFAQLARESRDVSDPIYAMLATFDRSDCSNAAAKHFDLPELPEILTKAFSSRLSLDNLLILADFGQSQPRFAQALAIALSRYNLHLYSNYRPQVDWFLQGLENYSTARGSQLLYFFIHIPEHIPVLSAMLERGVMVNGISDGGYDAYDNSGNHFHHAAVMHCMLHAPDKLNHWLETPWMEKILLGAPLRQTRRHVEAYKKKMMKRNKTQ